MGHRKNVKKSLEMMRCNNVVSSGGVLDPNQQCYIPLQPQEDKLRDYVNLVSVVLKVGKRVEEHVNGHFFLQKPFDNLMLSMMIEA